MGQVLKSDWQYNIKSYKDTSYEITSLTKVSKNLTG